MDNFLFMLTLFYVYRLFLILRRFYRILVKSLSAGAFRDSMVPSRASERYLSLGHIKVREGPRGN